MRIPLQSPPVSRGICSSSQFGADCPASASTDEVYAAAGGRKAQFDCLKPKDKPDGSPTELHVRGKSCGDPSTFTPTYKCTRRVGQIDFEDGDTILDGVEI